MFNGRTALNLDAKGRLTVPTRYRESLNSACGGRLVLTQHPYDACLVMYPFPEWRDIARIHRTPEEETGLQKALAHLIRTVYRRLVQRDRDVRPSWGSVWGFASSHSRGSCCSIVHFCPV